MINSIELEMVDTRTFSDKGASSMMIGAIAHGTTGTDNLTLDFHSRLNVTELASLKTLLDAVETRVSGELGASQ